MTQSQWFSRVGAEHAREIAEATIKAILAGDTRALAIYLERTEGKVVDHLTIEGRE